MIGVSAPNVSHRLPAKMTIFQFGLPRPPNRAFRYEVKALSIAGTSDAAAITSQSGRDLGTALINREAIVIGEFTLPLPILKHLAASGLLCAGSVYSSEFEIDDGCGSPAEAVALK